MINPSQSNFVGEKNIQTVLRAGESNRTWRIHRNFISADTCDSQQDSSPTAQSDFLGQEDKSRNADYKLRRQPPPQPSAT
jgi:hypothetical protein